MISIAVESSGDPKPNLTDYDFEFQILTFQNSRGPKSGLLTILTPMKFMETPPTSKPGIHEPQTSTALNGLPFCQIRKFSPFSVHLSLIKATIFNEDADAYFAWCDTNGDNEVSLWESASCGSKSAFWGPEGDAMTSWTDMFTYGTEIAYDFVNILLKYYKNLDLDGSGSLNRDEFRVSYAKMSLLSAYVEMDILDTNNDGLLNGNELKTFQTLTVRGANVCLPSKSSFRPTSGRFPVDFRSTFDRLSVDFRPTSGP